MSSTEIYMTELHCKEGMETIVVVSELTSAEKWSSLGAGYDVLGMMHAKEEELKGYSVLAVYCVLCR